MPTNTKDLCLVSITCSLALSMANIIGCHLKETLSGSEMMDQNPTKLITRLIIASTRKNMASPVVYTVYKECGTMAYKFGKIQVTL